MDKEGNKDNNKKRCCLEITSDTDVTILRPDIKKLEEEFFFPTVPTEFLPECPQKQRHFLFLQCQH